MQAQGDGQRLLPRLDKNVLAQAFILRWNAELALRPSDRLGPPRVSQLETLFHGVPWFQSQGNWANSNPSANDLNSGVERLGEQKVRVLQGQSCSLLTLGVHDFWTLLRKTAYADQRLGLMVTLQTCCLIP